METFSTTTKTIAWWLLGKLIKVVMDVSYCHRYYGAIIGEGGRPRYWSKGGTWNTVKKLLNVRRTDEWRGLGSAPMLTNTVSTQDSVTSEWGHWSSSSSSSPGHCHCQADHCQHWSIVAVSPGLCSVTMLLWRRQVITPAHPPTYTHLLCMDGWVQAPSVRYLHCIVLDVRYLF